MPDIGAGGFVGLAFETVKGTYVAPTKFFPIRSENLQYQEEKVERRVIRGIADRMPHLAGYSRIEGPIEFECTEDKLVYFLYAGRFTIVKTGAGPDFTYTATPNHTPQTPTGRTLSLAVTKNGATRGFAGCQVSGFSFTVDNGVLVCTANIVGRSEGAQTLAVYSGADTRPFGPGEYTISIPNTTPVLDVDDFTVNLENNAEAQHRLSTSRAPQWVKFGERNVQITMSRDFEDRTELDAFKANTVQTVRILASKGANNSVQFDLPAAYRSSYEVGGLSGQGDVIMASVAYEGDYDTATSKAAEIVVKTQENIT